MDVLIFAPFYPPHLGGLENYTEEFAQALSKKGVPVTVFTPLLPDDAAAREKISANLTVIRYPAFEVVTNYPLPKFWQPVFWKLFSGLFKAKHTVVISQTRFFFSCILALAYSKWKKVRWIHVEHGSDFVNVSSAFVTFVSKIHDKTVGRIVFKCSDLNVAISQAVKRFVIRFDRRDIPVIYRGLDLGSIDNAPSDHELLRDYAGKILVAFTGRLYKWKGVENSIRAILALPEDLKRQVVFVVAGDGEDKEKLQKISAAPVVFLGGVSRETVYAILKRADIYIHSALPGGGLSTSLLEAMYCRCAVIATKNEGADEVIEDGINGILIEASDPAVIREKLVRFIQDPQARISCSQKAREKVATQCSWDLAAERFLTYFN